MPFRKNSIGVHAPSVTNPFAKDSTPQPRVGEVREDGKVWNGREWTDERQDLAEDPQSGLPT